MLTSSTRDNNTAVSRVTTSSDHLILFYTVALIANSMLHRQEETWSRLAIDGMFVIGIGKAHALTAC